MDTESPPSLDVMAMFGERPSDDASDPDVVVVASVSVAGGSADRRRLVLRVGVESIELTLVDFA